MHRTISVASIRASRRLANMRSAGPQVLLILGGLGGCAAELRGAPNPTTQASESSPQPSAPEPAASSSADSPLPTETSTPAEASTPPSDADCVARLAPPLSPDLTQARTWLTQHLSTKPGASGPLALALRARTETQPEERRKLLLCAAQQLHQITKQPAKVIDASKPREDFLPFEFCDDSWLLQPERISRLYSTSDGAQWMAWPASNAREPQLEMPKWDESAAGPVLKLEDGSTRLFPHPSGKTSGGSFSARAFPSPDGTQIITSGDGAIRAYTFDSARLLWERTLSTRDYFVMPVHYSPSGQLVAVVGVEEFEAPKHDVATLHMLDARTGRSLWRFVGEERDDVVSGEFYPLTGVVWMPDSSRLVVSHARSVRVLDARSGGKLQRVPYSEPSRTSVSLSIGPRGRWLVSTQMMGPTRLLSLDGKHERQLPTYPGYSTFGFSPSGRFLFAAALDHKLYTLTDQVRETPLFQPRRCQIAEYELPLEACDAAADTGFAGPRLESGER